MWLLISRFLYSKDAYVRSIALRMYYYVIVNIENPPKPYWLDLDTGSDLTWLQCDAPCTKCLPAPHKPNEDLVTCMDPLCASMHWPETLDCNSPKDQCDYEVQYADHGSSLGLLVKDSFPLQYTNGTVVKPLLAFGCGYNQEVHASMDPPYTDGVLGLGLGKASILRQLNELGVTKNVVAHCLSAQGDGHLFFGEEFVPSSGLINDIEGKQIYNANEDKSLPVCWKGSKPFKSIQDVKNLFTPIMLSFAKSKNVGFQMDPEAYLIISKYGILNGSEVSLESVNLIGDISFHDKIIIYDNEKQQIGWAPANCSKLPKS
ncbi:hypothetical protein L1987_47123 [Smallanthus sonchifolius]|uniref:Uncharacterized protein n=1 Tax=Smallanthus sonchifolius TaxID=185202 RepID=A0ACB9G1J1_9ASTR|nr:hypothetical protein L1987_47123 [Smallanthus sonchifolius]